MADRKQTLIAIVGPTAVGKTETAIRLAEQVGGEVVSADSRQIYRQMDVGTAKPTAAQRARVPHHLIDVVDPDEAFSLAQYQAAAGAALEDVFARGKQPLLVGGTGLYVRAVTDGLLIPEVPPQPELRAELQARAAHEGGLALYAELQQVDPAAAERIDPRNVRRTIRALEVQRVSGGRFSELGRTRQPPYRVVRIGLTRPRPELYAHIDARVDTMIAAGLIDETRELLRRYDRALPALSGLGYKQVGAFLSGECSQVDAVAAIKRDTHRFVRRQANWFRPSDTRITWLTVTPDIDRDLLSILRRELNAVE